MSAEDIDIDLGDDEPEPQFYPFVRFTAGPDGITARAGWMSEDGELDSLEVDSKVGINQGQDAFAMAFGWYVDQLRAIEQRRQAEAGGEGGEP